MKIYILMASQGQWSDRREIPVKAYLIKTKAALALLKSDEKERIDRFESSQLMVKADEAYGKGDIKGYNKLMQKNAWSSFEETTYFINEVELEE